VVEKTVGATAVATDAHVLIETWGQPYRCHLLSHVKGYLSWWKAQAGVLVAKVEEQQAMMRIVSKRSVREYDLLCGERPDLCER
jgi:hypothetical protein